MTAEPSFARSAEGYVLALAGAIAGGVAAGYATGSVLERTSRDTPGVEDVAKGFGDMGTIVLLGFGGAFAGCYVLLRLRRHTAAGPTAAALLVTAATSPFLVLLLPGFQGVLWIVFLLVTPLLARAIGVRVPRRRRRDNPG